MLLIESEHRQIRTDASGSKFEYSDSDHKPVGEGWQRVDLAKHPRATKYVWVRAYSYVVKELKNTKRKPIHLDPTNLQPVTPGLFPKIDVQVGNMLAKLRNEIRLNMEHTKNPFLSGDRIMIKGNTSPYYVQSVNPLSQRIIAHNPHDKSDVRDISFADATITHELPTMPWSMHDMVDIKAGAIDRTQITGEVMGYDAQTGKVRVKVGSGSVEVYPEAIINVRGKNAADLDELELKLKRDPKLLGDSISKKILEGLLRASLSGRSNVSANEMWEDLQSIHGDSPTLGSIRASLYAIATLAGRGKDHTLFYNPVTDSINIEYGSLPLRLICSSRDIKHSNKLFGWKNLTKDDPKEAYAFVGQEVKITEGTGKDTRSVRCKIKSINGNKVTINVNGSDRVIHMGEASDVTGRRLIPDPTDPASFGGLNKSTFWLLRDREWCKDYNIGDVISLNSLLENVEGKRAKFGHFGRILDKSVDGKLHVQMDSGKTLDVSPRQVRQNKQVKDINQLHDRVKFNPDNIYGTVTLITEENGGKTRVGVGSEQSQKFLELSFDTGKTAEAVEGSYFTAIRDMVATHGQTRALMSLRTDDPEKPSKTLAPSKKLMDIINKLYPEAKTFMISREMRVDVTEPKGMAPKPLVNQVDQATASAEEMRSRKPGGTYKDYYAPKGKWDFDVDTDPNSSTFDEMTYIFDPQAGGFSKVGQTPPPKRNWSFPFFQGNNPSQTMKYSKAELDKVSSETPVRYKIIINPTDKQIKASDTGVVHNVTDVMANYSEYADPAKRKDVAPNSQITWDHHVRIHTDGLNAYLEIGKELAGHKSMAFMGLQGPMSLQELTSLPMSVKYGLWEGNKNADELLYLSSMFTYDPRHSRFQTRLSNYNDMHKFLKVFYGEGLYKSNVFEDLDGAYSARADLRKLGNVADAYKAHMLQQTTMIDDKLPDTFDGFRHDLVSARDYQIKTVNFMLSNNETLLANDQGTGKSACILATIKARMNAGEVKKALIVAPANLVGSMWPGEIEFFCKDSKAALKIQNNSKLSPKMKERALARLPASVDYHALTPKNKEAFFEAMTAEGGRPKIGVASYEMVNNYAKELQKMGFDLITLDEAQNIKTGKTKGREGAKRSATIKDVFSDVTYKIASTGTPLENSPDDFHSIVSFLNPTLLGSAEQFSQDFVETAYVDTAEGKKPVTVAVKNLSDLHERLKPIFCRVTKAGLMAEELKKMETDMRAKGEGSEFNPYLHYGSIAPRIVYPLLKIDPASGQLRPVDTPRPHDKYMDPKLGEMIDLDKQQGYDSYKRAISKVNKYYSEEFKGMQMQKTRSGMLNTKATSMLLRMQQALNDPTILAGHEAFRNDPDFQNPLAPNPKFDALMNIIKAHEKKDYRKNGMIPTWQNLSDAKTGRELALDTRGKTIIFCHQLEPMKALKRRLETIENGRYKGKVLYYSGSQAMGDFSGNRTNGKQQQKDVEHKFKNDPEYEIMIANDAAKTGLSFPQADLVVNYEMNWNPQDMNQRIDRAHRLGEENKKQYRPVQAFNIITKGTVEEKMVRAHAFRTELFGEMIGKTHQLGAERQKYVAAKFAQNPALHGEDKAAIMDELIREDPTMQTIQGMNAEQLGKLDMARKAKGFDAKAATLNKKKGLLSRVMGW